MEHETDERGDTGADKRQETKAAAGTGRGRPSSLAPRLDARLENLCARAFALREPLLGRTPRRAPGMLGGML